MPSPAQAAHHRRVDIRLLYIDDCPNWVATEQHLGTALSRLGRGAEAITHVLVETLMEAEELGFIGSPTVLLDGRDPFARGGEPVAMACRVFRTPDGLAGSPTVEQLVEALS